MAENSVSKLQNKVIILENKIVSLQDLVAVRKEKYRSLQRKYNYLEKNIENITNKAVNKATESLSLENEKLKLENEKLRKMLNLDSNNSGLPTSKTPINKKKRISNLREKSGKKIGGQIGHSKNKLIKFSDEEITDNYYHEISKCPCGGKLNIVGNRTKDEFDIEVRVKKIRHYFMEYKCQKCNQLLNVPIPNELKEENQYGNNIKAIAISLINEGCVSFNRTRNLIRGFSNNELDLSEGYLVKLQKNCSDKLNTFMNDLKVKIINQKKLNWDDTVIAINGKNACLRFYGTENLAYYTAHEKKNKETLDNDGILNNLNKDTVVIHDHNTVNYNKAYDFTNAECCVHLLRDLKSLNENLNHEWLNEMINFLVETNKKRNEYINQDIEHFEDDFIDFCMEEYDRIILFAKETNKQDYNKCYGSDEKALINRLIKYKENYLMWIIRFDIDFSNNLSERSLRSSKTKMKVSGQFKNLENARYYANIKSYIETCKRNNI
ncbi:MAG: transposase, partial [Bacilli bacterium]